MSPSWQNVSERGIVVDLVRVLVNVCKKRCKDITVLTPYILQRKKIESQIHHHCFVDQNPATRIQLTPEDRIDTTYESNTGKVSFKCPIQVCTVEAFQGKENKIIIVSCVRSHEEKQLGSDVRHALGFMAQPQRTNVAVSRAQDAMIIIGNANIFLRDPARVTGSNTYDRADSSTFGLWDGILGRIANYKVTSNTGSVVSNFVNLADPQKSLSDIRASLGNLASNNTNKNANDDDDDDDDTSSNEGLPMVREK